ncbi:MAG: DUF2721 domain-containing protein [Spirochaetales bacterium]|nr:DUF2721 domain-containing protein [Spirochaetales bacterium]
MDFTLTTPALLFPAISLLLLAYTNRYLTLSGLIRDLCDRRRDRGDGDGHISGQIENLRKRIYIIRRMQLFGVISFFLCVVTMLLLFLNLSLVGEMTFVASLASLLTSLAMSIREIGISIKALELMMD